MKLFIFLLSILFSGTAMAGERIYPELCVQDNIDKCSMLGYTEKSCPYGGGVACPFDKNAFSCPKWSCSDGNYYNIQPANADCSVVRYKGLNCYACDCNDGSINYNACRQKVAGVLDENFDCAEYGYEDSVTTCAEYIPCPANANKVHCLETYSTCKETGCLQKKEVPAHAIAVYEEVNCSCGGKKNVITDYNCDTESGYVASGNICVAAQCPTGNTIENVFDCGLENGWIKSVLTKDGKEVKSAGLTCYECVCPQPIPSGYLWTEDNVGVNGVAVLSSVYCDGKHYSECEKECKADVLVPDNADPQTETCEACGQTTPVIVGWTCREGYVINENGTACDPKECPESENGVYYSEAYQKSTDCSEIINKGAGWQFSITSIKSGKGFCGKCTCIYPDNDILCKYALSDTYNMNDARYEDLCCNGKYQSCTPTRDGILTVKPEHAKVVDHTRICGEDYLILDSCEEGYQVASNGTSCIENDCIGFDAESCPDRAECATCKKGETLKYKVTSCEDDRTDTDPNKWIDYQVSKDATRCCKNECDAANGYNARTTAADCKENQRLDVILNDCGYACGKCVAK